jgi:hypothetical protein
MAWPTGIPKNLTAAERVERARNAAQFRASADGLIKALSRKTLTVDQRQRLAQLLTTTDAVGTECPPLPVEVTE